ATPSFFTYDFVLACYVAICLLTGLYLLGLYRLPHDTPEEHVGVPRMLFGFLFLALGIHLLPALFVQGAEAERQRPAGTLYAWVDSFLLPESRAGKEEHWTANLEYAVRRAREQRKRVFIDFTGIT